MHIDGLIKDSVAHIDPHRRICTLDNSISYLHKCVFIVHVLQEHTFYPCALHNCMLDISTIFFQQIKNASCVDYKQECYFDLCRLEFVPPPVAQCAMQMQRHDPRQRTACPPPLNSIRMSSPTSPPCSRSTISKARASQKYFRGKRKSTRLRLEGALPSKEHTSNISPGQKRDDGIMQRVALNCLWFRDVKSTY